MRKFEITYCYDDPWAGVVDGNNIYTGTEEGLEEYCEGLKKMDCYNIFAAEIYDEDEG